MILWWVGAVLLLVVVGVVALVLDNLLRPAIEIQKYATDIAETVVLFPPHINAAVKELAKTQQLAAAARPEIERYGRAVERLV